jgi:hypothetical protein
MREFCFALFLLAGIARPADGPLALRWVYISRRLRSDQDVEDIRRLARTASENGLNAVLFASGLDSIDLQPREYLSRLHKVKQIFDEYRLEMIPLASPTQMYMTGPGYLLLLGFEALSPLTMNLALLGIIMTTGCGILSRPLGNSVEPTGPACRSSACTALQTFRIWRKRE